MIYDRNHRRESQVDRKCQNAVTLFGGFRRCAAPAVGFLILVCLSGCASIRQRLLMRSAECSKLCEQARSARDAGRTGDADQLLGAALRRRPNDTETRLQLAEELWSSGRQLAAAEEVELVLAESPRDTGAWLRLGQMQLEIGRTEAAWQAVQNALRQEPDCPAGLRLKAQLEERRGDPDAALATYHRLVQAFPDDLPAHLALAELHLRRGQPDRAAPLLRTASQHPGATPSQREEANWQLGSAYAQSGRWSDAAEVLTEAIVQRGETSADDWYRVAYVQSKAGNADAAAQSVSRALQSEPAHKAALDLARQLAAMPSANVSAIVPAGFRAPSYVGR